MLIDNEIIDMDHHMLEIVLWVYKTNQVNKYKNCLRSKIFSRNELISVIGYSDANFGKVNEQTA